MDGLVFIESGSGSGVSRAEGLGLTQLGGLYMENPSLRLIRRNSSSSPLEHETVRWVRQNEEALSEEMSPDYLPVRQGEDRDSRR